MMDEYITKQEARAALLQRAWKPNEWHDIKSLISSIPPADVRPVVHGRWIMVGGFFTPGGDPVWQCSECGKGRHVYGIEHGSYGADVSDGQWLACPNCMAIMERESDG